MGFSVWFLGCLVCYFSFPFPHGGFSSSLTSLSFLELGQFATVEDLIFFS